VIVDVRESLRSVAEPKRVPELQRFFKTGPGDYAEGDVFIGVRVPAVRRVAKRFWDDIPLSDCSALLSSEIHEERLIALLFMVRRYKRGSVAERAAVVSMYLERTDRINNWDLVDVSARDVVGEWLRTKSTGPRRVVLDKLVASEWLWDRRIAMISTHAFIRAGEFDETYRLAELLVDDPHDLMHKATGWMLREAGKKDERRLVRWLEKWAPRLPRTALRYSIERLPVDERKRLMAL
jgi:3-methyladenine DNA glycosylase AlkD